MISRWPKRLERRPRTWTKTDWINGATALRIVMESPQNDEAEGVSKEMMRCSPAFSRSRSFQETTEGEG